MLAGIHECFLSSSMDIYHCQIGWYLKLLPQVVVSCCFQKCWTSNQHLVFFPSPQVFVENKCFQTTKTEKGIPWVLPRSTGFCSELWRIIFRTSYSKWCFFALSTRVWAGSKVTQDTLEVDIPLLHHDIRMLQQVHHALDSPSSAT